MTKFVKAVFHKDVRTVEFSAGNGDRMLRSGGTLAWLFNNPGNLRPKAKSLYPGQIGVGDTKFGKLCIFNSAKAGRDEKFALLRRKYNSMTLRTAIFTYAPPTDNNDSERYLSYVKKRTGLADNVVLKELSDSQLESMMAAMEHFEGFDAKKETRKEKWVHVTQVTLSDGSRPIPDQPVTIRRGGGTSQVKTDAFGRLPPFVTLTPGEAVALQIQRGDSFQCLADFTLQDKSKSIVAFRFGEEYGAVLAGHNPLPASKPRKPAPIRYVIQPRDSLAKIARRFNIDPKRLAADNKDSVRDPDRVFPGQVIWIYGGREGDASINSRGRMPSTSSSKSVRAARSGENQGRPLGVISLEQRRAPWMEFALSEAKRWAGKTEERIDDSINYHNELGSKAKFPSMSGTKNAWCASFVNWCLRSSGYQISSPHPYRARSFIGDKNFFEVGTPIYGAIAVIGTHHVCFVYAEDESTGKMIMLGGNQSDQINFTVFRSKTRFFVPRAYEIFAKTEEAAPLLAKATAKSLNEALGIRVHVKAGGNDTT